MYFSGKENILGDTLSRACLQETAEEIPEKELDAENHMMQENTVAILQKIDETQNGTRKDMIMIMLIKYGQKNELQKEVKCFWPFREELSLTDGIIYKGERIVIPISMRKDLLKQLDKSHRDVEKTKWRARSAVYWPEMNKEIEKEVSQCAAFKETQNPHPSVKRKSFK